MHIHTQKMTLTLTQTLTLTLTQTLYFVYPTLLAPTESAKATKCKSNKVLRTIAEYDQSHQNTAGTQNDTTSPRAIRLKPTASITS